MSAGVAGLTLVLRTGPEPLSMVPPCARRSPARPQDQPIYAVRTMEQIISGSLAERRFTMLVLIIFAATALLLAAVGIYGVMSYAVTRRTHELGIRVGFGSVPPGDRRTGSAPRHAAGGDRNGRRAWLRRWRSRDCMAGLLYGVRPADPATLAAVALLLGGIALLACYIPARRATAVDPVVALRCE